MPATDAVHVLDTPSLGDRSYLVTDGDVAVVVDPQRDVERVTDLADELGVRITAVLETHVHNDYVTGGLALAKRLGADYLLPAGEDVAFGHSTAADGGVLHVGGLQVTALHTPGHTPTHTSYAVLLDEGALGDRTVGLFTGGSLLYGAVGRTDLISRDLTRRLALDQHASVRRLADRFADAVEVFPTHGFGSHCSSGTAEVHRSGTIADERLRNPALLEADAEAFADRLIAGYGPYPRYYARMGPANAAGPDAITAELPPLLSPAQVADHIAGGSWVVDLRTRSAYADASLPGTVNVELRNDLPTYLGWVYDYDLPLVLLAPDEADLREAQVMLGRIGIDDIAAAVGPIEAIAGGAELASNPRVMWDAVNSGRPDDAVVLDVRDRTEWDSGHHSAAVHIPFHDVLERIDELPDGPVWVYCATGNRAAVATSLLANAGRDRDQPRAVVLIDDFCLPGDVPG